VRGAFWAYAVFIAAGLAFFFVIGGLGR